MIQQEFPILEYDDDPTAVIEPAHEGLDMRLPEKCVYAFLGGEIEEYAAKRDLKILGRFESITKRFPVFLCTHKGEEICLVDAPMGAPAATSILDWLIGYGVRQVISAGCCGGLIDLPENTLLVPARALRDEGTSYHYLPASRFVDLDREETARICSFLERRGLAAKTCTAWTTDAFFRETRSLIRRRKEEGCEVVEMECAALAACAAFRGVRFGMILFTADTLADLENYDQRNFGADSFQSILPLLMDYIVQTDGS